MVLVSCFLRAAIQHLGISSPASLLGHSSAGVMWVWRTSLSGSSPGCLALFSTVASSHLIRPPWTEGHPGDGEAVQGGVQDPLQLWQAYIGETMIRPETRLKEHWEACQRGMLERSAVAEHAWKDHDSIRWEEARVVDKVKHPEELSLIRKSFTSTCLLPRTALTGTPGLRSPNAGWLH